MKYGFSGTRFGMNEAQRKGFTEFLELYPPTEFHHGCCVGADANAVECVRRTLHGVIVVGHPCNWPPLQDKEAIATSDQMRPCRKPLERNRLIVDETEALVACPKGPEELRSGTWSTIRYARKIGRPILIIWPNGDVTLERDARP